MYSTHNEKKITKVKIKFNKDPLVVEQNHYATKL